MENKCRMLGCPTPSELAYLLINEETKKAEGGFCLTHVEPILGKVMTGYHLEQMPDGIRGGDVPVKTSHPKPDAAHSPAPAQERISPMAEREAPEPVFDGEGIDDAREEAFDPNRAATPEELSTNFRWHYGDNQTYDLQTTVRGSVPLYLVEKHIQDVISVLNQVNNLGGHATITRTPGVTTKAAASAPAPARTGAPAPQPASAPARTGAPAPQPAGAPRPGGRPAGLPQPGQTSGTFHCVKLMVEPRDNGTIKLQFMPAGSKYPFPGLSHIRRPENLIPFLEQTGTAWEPKHFERATSYNVNYQVTWKNGENINSAGNPYKEVVSITPVGQAPASTEDDIPY